MRIGPARWRSVKGATPHPTVKLTPKQREAILATLRAHLLREDLAEEALGTVQGCLWNYARNLNLGMGADTKLAPSKQTAGELDRLAAAADALAGAIADLGPETRYRLFDFLELGGTPPWWPEEEPLEMPGQLAGLLHEQLPRIAECARRGAEQARAEERPRHRLPDFAALRLVEELARTWVRLTGRHPARGRGKPSPWEDFAFGVLGIAGIGSSGAGYARHGTAHVQAYEERWGPIARATDPVPIVPDPPPWNGEDALYRLRADSRHQRWIIDGGGRHVVLAPGAVSTFRKDYFDSLGPLLELAAPAPNSARSGAKRTR